MKNLIVVYTALVIFLGGVATGAVFLFMTQPVRADTENGCVVIGSVGNVTVGRCIDPETEDVIYVNTVGMLEIRKD